MEETEKPRLRLVSEEDELWTAEEVAAWLRVSVDCVWRWCRERKGGIPHARVGGQLRFPVVAVKEWFRRQVAQ